MLIFRQKVATTRLKTVFVIESFMQEIPVVKQVLLKAVFYFVQINIYIFTRPKQWTFCQNHY